MQLPIRLGYFLERFPLISNLYTVKYQLILKNNADATLSSTPKTPIFILGKHPSFILKNNAGTTFSSTTKIAILTLRKHPFYALLHDIMNPLRIVSAALDTFDRAFFSTVDAIDNLSNNKVLRFFTKIVWALGLLALAFTGYFIGQLNQIPVSYQKLNAELNQKKAGSEPIPLPLRSASPSEKGFFHWLYEKLKLKGGTLQNQHTENKIKAINAEIETRKASREKIIQLYKDLDKILYEEQFDNPPFIFGVADIPYQIGRYVAQCVVPDAEDTIKVRVITPSH